ncbi:MAG: prolyl oligopeptidase family serine peptidase, partial [Acidobacteriota bacterium]
MRNSLAGASGAARICLLAFLIAAIALAISAQEVPAALQARLQQIFSAMRTGHAIGQVAISPDGKRLAWIEGGRGGGSIRVAPFDRLQQSRRVAASAAFGVACSESRMAWSPDSKSLAFLSDCAAPGEQDDLYLSRLDGQPARRLTSLNGYVAAPAFSPDGSRIAFLYVEGATRPAGALAAEDLPSGVIGKTDLQVQRVAIADAQAPQAAAPDFATPANLHVFEFDWSPDSRSLAYIAADPPGENNWWVAKLYTQPVNAAGSGPGMGAGPATQPRVVLAPAGVDGPLHGLQIALPRWSPDGRAIALIGGLMSDQGVTGGDVWMVSAQGGAPRDLTPGRPSTPVWLQWGGNRSLFVSEIAGGEERMFRLQLHGGLNGKPDAARVSATAGGPIFSFPGSIGAGGPEMSLSSTSDRSIFVFTAGAFEHAPEIYAARPVPGPYPRLAQLTRVNDNLHPVSGPAVSLDWTNEGFRVQGWLMLPKDYDPAKKYPLIVEVHGGPASAIEPRWSRGWALSPAVFSAMGYFVLQPNPRGSYGQGERFVQANRKDFGYGDLRDILAGVDTVVAKYPVDPRRIGLTGWSYGGFMSMFAVTQTHRFRAAVAGAGISDWKSYYGENQIDQWMIPYFGASVYDDPQVYAKSSAIDFIKRAQTPTLIVVGDRDGECPAPQSFEFWHALRDLR